MHYFSGKGCSEFLEIMHYCIGILTKYVRLPDLLIDLDVIQQIKHCLFRHIKIGLL